MKASSGLRKMYCTAKLVANESCAHLRPKSGLGVAHVLEPELELVAPVREIGERAFGALAARLELAHLRVEALGALALLDVLLCDEAQRALFRAQLVAQLQQVRRDVHPLRVQRADLQRYTTS